MKSFFIIALTTWSVFTFAASREYFREPSAAQTMVVGYYEDNFLEGSNLYLKTIDIYPFSDAKVGLNAEMQEPIPFSLGDKVLLNNVEREIAQIHRHGIVKFKGIDGLYDIDETGGKIGADGKPYIVGLAKAVKTYKDLSVGQSIKFGNQIWEISNLYQDGRIFLGRLGVRTEVPYSQASANKLVLINGVRSCKLF